MDQNQLNNEQSDAIEIDLKDLFLELLEHWKAILITTLLLSVLAFSYSRFLATPMYESTSKLYVLSKSTSITSITDLQIGSSLTSDYMEVVSGRPVLDTVIENLSLSDDYESLKGRTTLENPSNSRIMNITVRDADPKEAKEIADEIANVAASYISEKMDQDPPTIIQAGYSDEGPVSPNIPRNTLVGALVGLLLSAGIVTLLYILNDKIVTPEDIEKKLGMHVLGTLPKDIVEDDGEGISGKN